MDATFKDFLGQGYTHMSIFNKHTNSKELISADLVFRMEAIKEKETAILYYGESNKIRMVVTPFSLDQLMKIFTEGI